MMPVNGGAILASLSGGVLLVDVKTRLKGASRVKLTVTAMMAQWVGEEAFVCGFQSAEE